MEIGKSRVKVGHNFIIQLREVHCTSITSYKEAYTKHSPQAKFSASNRIEYSERRINHKAKKVQSARKTLMCNHDNFLLVSWCNSPTQARAASLLRILDHTRHTIVGTTSLDGWSARHRDLYLTTHNTHKRQSSMPPDGFELAIPAGDRPQILALDSSATRVIG